MKMKVNGNVVEDDVSIEGLLDCKMKHEIKESKGSMLYTGPKIPPEVWKEILSFFKWCYTTYHSECQVRLFVSLTQNTWRAYAFPQEAKTGMTAREIDNDEAKAQRAGLNMNPPDWIYFGTVHHHCGAGAFQSGTDEDNEKGQDGLHITIGKVDEKKHDIHARFYRRGMKFNPDMSWFYDITPALTEVTTWINNCPARAIKVDPVNVLGFKDKDLLARDLMCEPSDVDFPQIWKDNIIEIKREPIVYPYSPTTNGGSTYKVSHVPSKYSPETDPMWQRARAAWKEILFYAAENEVSSDDLGAAVMDATLENFAPHIVLMACKHHKVDPSDLEKESPPDLERALVEEVLQQQKDKEDGKKDPAPPKPNTSAASGASAKEEKPGGGGPAGGITDHQDPDWSHLQHGM